MGRPETRDKPGPGGDDGSLFTLPKIQEYFGVVLEQSVCFAPRRPALLHYPDSGLNNSC